MDRANRRFTEIINLAKNRLKNVEIIENDISIQRALLKLKGDFNAFSVRITEIIDKKKRKYSYYVLKENEVIFGYDNAPDIRALKLKFGDEYHKHLNESVPHYHGKNKKEIKIGNEIQFEDFMSECARMVE